MQEGNVIFKGEPTAEYLARARSLLFSAISGGGTAATKDAFLEGVTRFFISRLDESDSEIKETGRYEEIRERADRLRDDLIPQLCERQKRTFLDLEYETSALEDATEEGLFFAGVREDLAFRRAAEELARRLASGEA